MQHTSHFVLKASVSSCKSDKAASKTFIGVSFESIVSTRTWQSNIRGCGMRYPAKRTLVSLRSCSRIKFPRVWSSFERTKVPAFGFLLSGKKVSLFSSLSSSHLHESARSGTLMIFADMVDRCVTFTLLLESGKLALSKAIPSFNWILWERCQMGCGMLNSNWGFVKSYSFLYAHTGTVTQQQVNLPTSWGKVTSIFYHYYLLASYQHSAETKEILEIFVTWISDTLFIRHHEVFSSICHCIIDPTYEFTMCSLHNIWRRSRWFWLSWKFFLS